MIVRLDFSDEESSGSALRLDEATRPDSDFLVQLGPHLPFSANSVDEMRLGRGLAYVDDLVATMEEVWRIAKPSALVHARLPHASSSWSASRDPRLRRPYTLETFRYFAPGARNLPTCATFELERARLHLKARQASRPNDAPPKGALANAIERVANQSRGMQYRWERWLGPLFGGFEEFSVVLSAAKAPPIL